MIIRKCNIKDVNAVYDILRVNDQIGAGSVDNPEALKYTVGNSSVAFFEKLGFYIVPTARFMLNEDIDRILKI
ncbi:MAG: hypothetical protein AB1485_05520 [Candidatus Thermoplasmatota archaeon]